MDAYKLLQVSPRATKDEIREAYRALARKWHPDRFPEGPERDWAEKHMTEINTAYRACLDGTANRLRVNDDTELLGEIEHMLDNGQYHTAREKLMSMSTRCAEWNYLFGRVLLKLADTKKALIYLGVAARQKPDNAKYVRALKEAQTRKSVFRFR